MLTSEEVLEAVDIHMCLDECYAEKAYRIEGSINEIK